MTAKPEVKTFFDEETFTACHIVSDPATGKAAIIDSVLDFDPASGRTSTASAEAIVEYIKTNGLAAEWILETHVHADHLTAAPFLKEKLGGKTAIGSNITLVQNTFGDLFNAEPEFMRDGSQFDALFDDGAEFKLGSIDARVIWTPGHTPACLTYLIGDAAFVGDTLFMPDYGTARCDFPGGDAATLYKSIQKLFALADETRLFMCHDYKAPGRDEYVWETTVKDEREKNIHVGGGKSQSEFVNMRTERDATLAMPRLILPSVQLNMRAGEFPPPDSNGVRYIKLPLNKF
ncbi:MAG: MBL fold metallo-hydrolase [Parvularculaceae bacterium]|nr:MBL fold metallo-hydrolase [Parvularculaceae bacterium]